VVRVDHGGERTPDLRSARAAGDDANRWVLAAWPGAVIVATWLALRPRAVRVVVYGVLALASVGLLRELIDGRFIG